MPTVALYALPRAAVHGSTFGASMSFS